MHIFTDAVGISAHSKRCYVGITTRKGIEIEALECVHKACQVVDEKVAAMTSASFQEANERKISFHPNFQWDRESKSKFLVHILEGLDDRGWERVLGTSFHDDDGITFKKMRR